MNEGPRIPCPFTLIFIALLIGIYAIWGPQSGGQSVVTVLDHLLGIFLHGSIEHLLGNAVLIGIGGWLTEPRIGSLPTAALAALCACTGIGFEFLLAGTGFIGASGVAYGLVSYGMIASAPAHQRLITVGFMVLALAAELLMGQSNLAVYVHIAAALTGGGFAMFEALFGNKGPTLKPMEWKHVSRVIEIIAQTDEDDALEAERTLIDIGYENMFVLVERGQVLGVTGFGLDDQAPDLAWLSWTYLDEAEMGRGLGGKMVDDLLGKLAGFGVRKIFIETSDYEEDGQKLYAAAHKLYEDFGATVELTLADYHAPGEAKIIYGLENPEAPATPEAEKSDNTGLVFTDLQDAPETDDVAGLAWDEAPVGVAGIDHYLSKAREKNYRMVVLSIPTDLSDANRGDLEQHGFQHQGRLKDYYCTGLHQEWWTCVM